MKYFLFISYLLLLFFSPFVGASNILRESVIYNYFTEFKDRAYQKYCSTDNVTNFLKEVYSKNPNLLDNFWVLYSYQSERDNKKNREKRIRYGRIRCDDHVFLVYKDPINNELMALDYDMGNMISNPEQVCFLMDYFKELFSSQKRIDKYINQALDGDFSGFRRLPVFRFFSAINWLDLQKTYGFKNMRQLDTYNSDYSTETEENKTCYTMNMWELFYFFDNGFDKKIELDKISVDIFQYEKEILDQQFLLPFQRISLSSTSKVFLYELKEKLFPVSLQDDFQLENIEDIKSFFVESKEGPEAIYEVFFCSHNISLFLKQVRNIDARYLDQIQVIYTYQPEKNKTDRVAFGNNRYSDHVFIAYQDKEGALWALDFDMDTAIDVLDLSYPLNDYITTLFFEQTRINNYIDDYLKGDHDGYKKIPLFKFFSARDWLELRKDPEWFDSIREADKENFYIAKRIHKYENSLGISGTSCTMSLLELLEVLDDNRQLNEIEKAYEYLFGEKKLEPEFIAPLLLDSAIDSSNTFSMRLQGMKRRLGFTQNSF